ncbi:MAG: hypothetical protein JW827_03635 [Spirochaetes bacterium]|nr:hypothetical protein [Spirochaetota bacterium]
MVQKLRLLIFFIFSILFLSTCSQDYPMSPNTLIPLDKDAFKVSQGNGGGNSSPGYIVSGQVTITKGVFSHTEPLNLTQNPAQSVFENIHLGHWDIYVQLFDSQNNVIYAGTGQAVCKPGKVTEVTIDVTSDVDTVKPKHTPPAKKEDDPKNKSGTLIVYVNLPVIYGLILWNKLGSDIEVQNSEIGPDGSPNGVIYAPCKFSNGFKPVGDRNYIDFDNNVIQDQGCIEFWWKPDENWNYAVSQKSVFLDSQSMNYPPNDSWGLWFSYVHHSQIISVAHSVMDSMGHYTSVGGSFTPVTTWSANDLVHIAMVWDRNKQIEGQYSLAVYINGILQQGYTDDLGPSATGYMYTKLRTGSSHFNYSLDSNVRGYMDNIKIWNFAKTDFSDRFVE